MKPWDALTGVANHTDSDRSIWVGGGAIFPDTTDIGYGRNTV